MDRDSLGEFFTVLGILLASLAGAAISAHFGPWF